MVDHIVRLASVAAYTAVLIILEKVFGPLAVFYALAASFLTACGDLAAVRSKLEAE